MVAPAIWNSKLNKKEKMKVESMTNYILDGYERFSFINPQGIFSVWWNLVRFIYIYKKLTDFASGNRALSRSFYTSW